jgi:DeoR family transcriptional regulator of aga operon
MTNISQRHDAILKALRDRGRVTVASLSEALGVSSVTIRKDLRVLEEQSLLYRTHGGAHLRNPYVLDRPLQDKANVQAEEKQRIGEAAAKLVRPHDSLLLASGTTMTHLARQLHRLPGVTVVTSALNVALELAPVDTAEVLLLGGTLRHSSVSVVGSQAEAMLGEIACDTLFLGIDGFDLDFGFTTSSAAEATLNRAMIRASQHVVILTDSTKFNRRSFGRICTTDEVDRIITDDGIDAAMIEALEARGVDVDVV